MAEYNILWAEERTARQRAEADAATLRVSLDALKDAYQNVVAFLGESNEHRDYMIHRIDSLQSTLNTINADNDSLREQLAQAQAELRNARDLAGIMDGDANTLTDWIVGAQEEIDNLANQLSAIWLDHESYTPRILDDETPLGQALDGAGDEGEP